MAVLARFAYDVGFSIGAMTMGDYKLLIKGKLVSGDEVMAVINPATEETIVECPKASEAQLNVAVAAAKEAFPAWSATSIEERKKVIGAIKN